MTTTDVAYTSLTKNAGTALAAAPGTTLVVGSTNDMRVVNAEPERTVFYVTNTDDDTNLNFVVTAGGNPPSLRAGQGNLTVSISESPQVSQPAPFSRGRTVVTPNTRVGVQEEGKKLAVVKDVDEYLQANPVASQPAAGGAAGHVHQH